ncbi:MAG: thioredoxin family protein [Alphaproteobacteria bacterium]|nr:thioredoxin family protein [Alphaproteobacteria bacterium]
MFTRTVARRLLCAALFACGAWLWPVPSGDAVAATSAWSSEEPLDATARPARLRLLAGGPEKDGGDTLLLGLEFELLPGWKVYWRAPGDAGYPPEVDWSGSENLAPPSFLWPVPERFRVLGLETLGYHNGVVFPVRAGVQDANAPVRLRARVTYLVCDEICIPGEADLSLDLAGAKAGAASPERTAIAHALARVPGEGAPVGLAVERAEYAEASGLLSVVGRAEAPFRSPDLYVEGPEGLFFAAPETRFWSGRRHALFRLAVEGPGGVPPKLAALRSQDLRFTLVDGAGKVDLRAVERILPVSPAPVGALAPETLAAVLLLALLGGLILNLMPCVLPVLSLKLLALAGHGGAARVEVRKGFLASVAGILFAFLLLATLIALLRGAGHAVGWGFQFQAPLFLLSMIVVLTLFAANLWGFFEIRLPGALQIRLAGKGGQGMAGHFLTGVFATALATPCSAPFLGTSIGFALSRGPLEIYAIFTALGLGLALPYLLVVAFPALATRLPRPGPWMGVLRRLLGLALLATALWLLTVFASEIGERASLAVGVLMAGLFLATGLRARFPKSRRSLGALIALFLLLPLAVTLTAPGAPSPPPAAGEGPWQPFDAGRIPALVADGKLVFVDVTAKWCLTCRANKELVLDQGGVRERLESEQVVAMRADWTRPDERIADYLATFGRFGIPFNVVYGPAAPAGVPLPELLTQAAVLKAMAQAEGAK